MIHRLFGSSSGIIFSKPLRSPVTLGGIGYELVVKKVGSLHLSSFSKCIADNIRSWTCAQDMGVPLSTIKNPNVIDDVLVACRKSIPRGKLNSKGATMKFGSLEGIAGILIMIKQISYVTI